MFIKLLQRSINKVKRFAKKDKMEQKNVAATKDVLAISERLIEQNMEKYNMKYVRINRKPCMHDIGKRKFGFDYKEEIIRYKYLTGERMSSSEWKKMEKYEKCNSYFAWKELIEKNNKEKTEEQLKEFDHYLDNRINMADPQKELYIIMCSVVLTGITTFFLDHIDIFDKVVIIGHPIISIICSIIFLVVIMSSLGFVMFNVMSPIWSTTIETTFLKEYQHVIKKMLQK